MKITQWTPLSELLQETDLVFAASWNESTLGFDFLWEHHRVQHTAHIFSAEATKAQ